ncbi:PTS sorbitol transporter subunit IIA [Saccharopolyspora erythraea]|uniref:PTS glucitol/sorbitol transporter subunit IIA n=1 Tax=Saccharopolyspora erythraea TaxID=1836 RepID=UPI001BAC67A1|nr:PTS glucitol/sorbitol transporter subunit IIA [Saccharopolyspora erythraea]QUH04134.1 PTS sorbitol transporter subunit IIA [Saccharopolyspora erythraea]
MGNDYYESTILRVGEEAADLIAGGVLILYADPIPDALESVSVVHSPSTPLVNELRAGDTLWLGDQRVELTEVGERATENLRTLGHVVIHLNPDSDTKLLPGAVHGRGEIGAVEAGARLVLQAVAAKV